VGEQPLRSRNAHRSHRPSGSDRRGRRTNDRVLRRGARHDRGTFGSDRKALRFGTSKINLHERGRELEPKAVTPTPGSADLCLIAGDSLDDVVAELTERGIAIEEGPVQRTGARGPLTSVYIRDPDGNLIELANELEG
jgi:catechol 2,3-dioxygenase-like lactoylglutathione lyase family enzyme